MYYYASIIQRDEGTINVKGSGEGDFIFLVAALFSSPPPRVIPTCGSRVTFPRALLILQHVKPLWRKEDESPVPIRNC